MAHKPNSTAKGESGESPEQDAATNALKLVETLCDRDAGTGVKQETADEITRVLGLIDAVRKKDLEFMIQAVCKVNAEMSGQPIGPMIEAGMAACGMRAAPPQVDPAAPAHVDGVELDADPDEPAVVVEVKAEQTPAQRMVTTLPSFADVISKFAS